MIDAAQPTPPLPATATALGAVAVLAIAATVAPLWTYTVGLATLGGAHVLVELRYVDARFADRALGRLWHGLTAGLGCVVALRVARAGGLWSGSASIQAELAVVAGLAAWTLPTLARRGPAPLAVGAGCAALLAAAALDPVPALLLLAAAHNWTPVGFLVDAVPARERHRAAAITAVAFGAVPVAIALGLPRAALGGALPPAGLLGAFPGAGPLAAHFGATLPATAHDAPWAPDAFAALAYAQSLHYAVVLGVLPRLAPGHPRAAGVGLARMPPLAFAGAVLAVSALGCAAFWTDYGDARRWYGVAAAVHAWIEIPALLLALLGADQPAVSQRPIA
jgi:hypothetical protein